MENIWAVMNARILLCGIQGQAMMAHIELQHHNKAEISLSRATRLMKSHAETAAVPSGIAYIFPLVFSSMPKTSNSFQPVKNAMVSLAHTP